MVAGSLLIALLTLHCREAEVIMCIVDTSVSNSSMGLSWPTPDMPLVKPAPHSVWSRFTRVCSLISTRKGSTCPWSLFKILSRQTFLYEQFLRQCKNVCKTIIYSWRYHVMLSYLLCLSTREFNRTHSNLLTRGQGRSKCVAVFDFCSLLYHDITCALFGTTESEGPPLTDLVLLLWTLTGKGGTSRRHEGMTTYDTKCCVVLPFLFRVSPWNRADPWMHTGVALLKDKVSFGHVHRPLCC